MKTSNSMWTILIMGVFCFMAIAVLMLMGLDKYKDSPVGNQMAVANQIQKQFNHEITTVNLNKAEKGETYSLEVLYQVPEGSPGATDEEMKEVAEYAIQRFRKDIMEGIESVAVTRFELRGSGCSQKTLKESRQFENPFRPKKTNPYDWEDGGF